MDESGRLASSLARLQRSFLEHILHHDPAMSQEVMGTARVPVHVRLSIYAEGYRLRLIEALEDMFPALHTLLGDEAWDIMARHYIQNTPSHHFSIRYYGHSLADFLCETPPYRHEPCLAEMAQFEWRLRDVFDAPDMPAITLSDLTSAGIGDWAQVLFALHPAVQLVRLSWNIPSLWKAVEQDSAPITPCLSERPVSWVLWRSNLTTYFRSLDEVEEVFFWGLQSAKSFGEICDELAMQVGEQEAVGLAAGLVQRVLNDGLIADFRADAKRTQ